MHNMSPFHLRITDNQLSKMPKPIRERTMWQRMIGKRLNRKCDDDDDADEDKWCCYCIKPTHAHSHCNHPPSWIIHAANMLLLRAKIVWNSSTTATAAFATQIAPFLRLFLLTTLNGNGKYSLVVSIAQLLQEKMTWALVHRRVAPRKW